jgi:hypothetical protein
VRNGIRLLCSCLVLAALYGGTSLVAVARAQVAAFNFEPGSPVTGDVVTFDGSGSTGTGTLTWQWDFDASGEFVVDATGMVVSRSFTLPGNHVVALRVSDQFGSNTAFRVVPVGNRPPGSSFVHFPPSPFPGELISFISTASDPDGPLVQQAWDLDGDGSFDDDAGPTAAASFPAPGSYLVGLWVVDSGNVAAASSHSVVVVPLTPGTVAQRAASIPLLSPFPVIRISGGFTRRGTRLRRLAIDAPAGARVVVRCGGRRCPFRRRSYTAAAGRTATAVPHARAARVIRVRRLERRLLRPEVLIKVFVTKPQTIGKYTRFRIRRSRPPARVDRCLIPGVTGPHSCPSRRPGGEAAYGGAARH